MRNEAVRAAGQSIRTVREAAGLTLAEAAQIAGRSVKYMQQLEAGQITNVSEKTVANTIGVLGARIAQRPHELAGCAA